jgi:ferritin
LALLHKDLEKAINNQINAEIYSAYLYYSMAAYFESLSLKGFSHWMRVQALEELTHVQKFTSFVHDRGGKVALQAVEAPSSEWNSPLDAFVATYEHEVKVTGLINDLMDLAQKYKDHATVNFMQWFVGEQVEEEASVDDVVQKLKLINRSEGGLFMLDRELDARTFVMPPDLAGVF